MNLAFRKESSENGLRTTTTYLQLRQVYLTEDFGLK